MKLIAMLTEPASVSRFLSALGEPTDLPARSPSRGPPYWKSTLLRRKALATSRSRERGPRRPAPAAAPACARLPRSARRPPASPPQPAHGAHLPRPATPGSSPMHRPRASPPLHRHGFFRLRSEKRRIGRNAPLRCPRGRWRAWRLPRLHVWPVSRPANACPFLTPSMDTVRLHAQLSSGAAGLRIRVTCLPGPSRAVLVSRAASLFSASA